MKKQTIFLLVIILLGLSLRLYNLDYQSIWTDEAQSLYQSKQPLTHIFSIEDNSPPLYYTLLHFWNLPIGINLLGARLLSVLAGTLSIYIIYLLSKTLFNEKASLISSFFLAISPLHIYYSQEARVYSIFTLFSLLSIYFYLEYKKKISKRSYIGYILSTVFLLYSHIYSVFILLAQNLHYLIKNKDKQILHWFASQLTLLILFTPWLMKLPEVIATGAHSWISPPVLLDLFVVFYSFTSGIVFSIPGLIVSWLFFAVMIKYAFSKEKNAPLLSYWFLIPTLLPFFYSLLFSPIFTIKYVIISSIPLYLVTAYVLSKSRRKHFIALISIISILLILTTMIQQNTTLKDDWKSVSKIIEAQDKEIPILVLNSYESLPFSFHYSKECFSSEDTLSCLQDKQIFGIDNIIDFNKVSSEEFWLILSRENYNEEFPQVNIILSTDYDQLSNESFTLYYDSLLIRQLYFKLGFESPYNSSINTIKVLHLKKK